MHRTNFWLRLFASLSIVIVATMAFSVSVTAHVHHAQYRTHTVTTVSPELIVTIKQLRSNYPAYKGKVVTVKKAVVTRNYGPVWYIQDKTGGIRVYVKTGSTENIGDLENVTGVAADYKGDIEIDPKSAKGVKKVGTGTVPSPVTVTTKQVAQLKYTDPIDGELATIPTSTITSYLPPSIGLTDSSGTQCTAYFDSYALMHINLANFKQGDTVATIGALGLYGASLGTGVGQILPLLTTDFVKK